jgi:hypothetical protein
MTMTGGSRNSSINTRPTCFPKRITTEQTELALWRETEMPDRTLVFHHYSRPARVWAVNVSPAGIAWAEAEIIKITAARVSVVYNGVRAPLDRINLCSLHGAWWRGVRFVTECTGRKARYFERMRREWFGHRPDFRDEAMSLEEARRIVGLREENYTRDDIIAAFRRVAKRCHPDLGGTDERFMELIKARDRLLASIGTSAPTPKMPTFAPAGVRLVYRSWSGRSRIGSTGGMRRLSVA